MPDDDSQEITQYLKQCGAGDRQALEHILPLVYHELRTIARHQMSRERPEHTLQPTALVGELYLRLERSRAASGRIARTSSPSPP